VLDKVSQSTADACPGETDRKYPSEFNENAAGSFWLRADEPTPLSPME